MVSFLTNRINLKNMTVLEEINLKLFEIFDRYSDEISKN